MTYLAVGRFLETSRQPVLMEPGEDPLPLSPGNFQLNWAGQATTLEAWGEMRNLVRRVRAIHSRQRSRLELESRTVPRPDRPVDHKPDLAAIRRIARLRVGGQG